MHDATWTAQVSAFEHKALFESGVLWSSKFEPRFWTVGFEQALEQTLPEKNRASPNALVTGGHWLADHSTSLVVSRIKNNESPINFHCYCHLIALLCVSTQWVLPTAQRVGIQLWKLFDNWRGYLGCLGNPNQVPNGRSQSNAWQNWKNFSHR